MSKISDDIELLVRVALSEEEGGTEEVEKAAERVEVWLATFDPSKRTDI